LRERQLSLRKWKQEVEEETKEPTNMTETPQSPYQFLLKLLKDKYVQLFICAVLTTVLSCVLYIATMLTWTTPGFNLDDSWIHLQFARTIYEGTPFEYSPGYPSTGSTSPLWSIILSSIFFFTQDPTKIVWGTYIISAAFYSMSSFLVGYLIDDYTENKIWGFMGIVAFVLMPRNTWLMLSGMETPVFVFILLLSVVVLDKHEMKYDPILGIIAGLAFLARPEGILVILVLIPARFIILGWKRELSWKRLGSMLLMGGIALVIVAPWILYCISVTGYPLPDTFYAKVGPPTEVGVEAWNIFWNSFLVEFPFIVIGAATGLTLVAKGKPHTWLLAISLTLLYRFTLPYFALINNFRYLIPVFDFFLITAVGGLSIVIKKSAGFLKIDRKIEKDVLTVGLVFFLLIFPSIPHYMFQASFYGNAVKNINEQQVYIGTWLKNHTPEDAVLAIHDAGAIRFFSNRVIIDMARLISPDITHGNMSHREELVYLKEHNCTYFVFFNELFPIYSGYLIGAYDILLTVHLEDNVISGRDTMSVYLIRWEDSQFA
jgi:hypothetical protein